MNFEGAKVKNIYWTLNSDKTKWTLWAEFSASISYMIHTEPA